MLVQNEKGTLNKNDLEPSLVSKIFDALLGRLWLIIILIIVGVVIGAVYGKVRKREYVVYHDVGFTAQNTAIFQTLRSGENINTSIPSGVLSNGREYYISDKGYRYVKSGDTYYQIDETDGGFKIKENDTTHINTANKYIDTVVGFVNTGVVIDRANFYYNQFESLYQQELKENSKLDKEALLQKYIDTISETKFTNESLKEKAGEWFDVCLYKKENKSEIIRLCFKGFDDANKLKFVDSDGNEKLLSRYENANSPVDSILYVKYSNNYANYVVGFSNEDLVLNKDKKFNVILHKIENDGSWKRVVLQNVKFVDIIDNKLTFKNGEDVLSFSRYDGKNKEVNSYVYSVECASDSEQYNYYYNKVGISSSKIKVLSNKNKTNVTYDFSVGYQDVSNAVAQEKLKFIILATKQEVKTYAEGYDYSETRTDAILYQYFNIVSINIVDLGYQSTQSDISTKKLVVIFGVGGFVASLLVIYILSMFDSTITTKKELEKITKASVLAIIEEVNEEDK